MRAKLGLDEGITRERFGVRAHFRLADGKAQVPWVEVFIGNKIEIYATPLPNQEISVALLAKAGALHGNIAAEFLRVSRSFPALSDRLEGAQQITRLMGATPISGNARRSATPGALLLGDADRHDASLDHRGAACETSYAAKKGRYRLVAAIRTRTSRHSCPV
jgi:hypothetical protein